MRSSPWPIAVAAALVFGAWLGATSAVIAASADDPIYKPPARNAPTGRIGLGTRSIVPPRQVWALAPDHTGLTTREAPTLYWFVGKPVATRVELAAVGGDGSKPMLEESLPGPAAAGVQKIDLSRYGIRLQPGVEYRWTVSIEGEPKQRPSTVAIQRIAAGPDLVRRLDATPRAGRTAAYAEEGIWYDAIGSISELIELAPNDAALRGQRAALLEQVGLKEAAAGDRQRQD